MIQIQIRKCKRVMAKADTGLASTNSQSSFIYIAQLYLETFDWRRLSICLCGEFSHFQMEARGGYVGARGMLAARVRKNSECTKKIDA